MVTRVSLQSPLQLDWYISNKQRTSVIVLSATVCLWAWQEAGDVIYVPASLEHSTYDMS